MSDEIKGKVLIVAVVIIAALIGGGIGAYFFSKNSSDTPPAPTAKPTPQASTDLSLNGIDVGIDFDKLQEILGQATSSENMGGYEIFRYDNLKVEVRNNKVSAIMTDSPNVKTSRGIQVGSSYSDIVSAYGTNSQNHLDKLMTYEYSLPALNNQEGTLTFSVDGSHLNDQVVNISVRLIQNNRNDNDEGTEQAKLALHRFLNALARKDFDKAYDNMLTMNYKSTVNKETFVRVAEQLTSLDFNDNFNVISAKPNSVVLGFEAGARKKLEPSGTLYTPWTGEIEMVNESNIWKINVVKAERGQSIKEK
ncbi:MAG: hypothetical protein IJS29_05815 [Selenomonadaceae bacterium]|nr:hypothetical protein [Selenomonadaceae bacterium]